MELRFLYIPLFLTALLTILIPSKKSFAQDEEFIKNLPELSLEELMNLEVITVEKRTKKVQNTASAIYIITNEDIRRSGATSIVESLRGAPGIQVSRIDSNLWAVSSRGFNERYSNKLLVMIDGRTVYTPIFSGVYWDVQDTVLEDIERIEVVRGPGSTIWGANAVNGVINVITKNASKTQGWLYSQIIGNEDRVITTLRYGGKSDSDIFWRLFAKYADRDGFVDMQGDENHDEWRTGRIGFRIDWLPSMEKSLTIQGDAYTGKIHSRENIPILTAPYVVDSRIDEDVQGGNILVRYRHSFSSSSDIVIQSYYDRVERHQRFDIAGYHEDYQIDTVDFDITHTFNLYAHHFTWGGGVRYITDHIDNNTHIRFDPTERKQLILNAFVQDQIELIKEKFYFILGSKIEHNEYTHFEYEPTARILWHPAKNHTLWAAVSRAVRTPSRIEMDGRIDQYVIAGTPPTMVSLISKEGFESEKLIAYELGYRANLVENLYFDIAGFYNKYDNLRSFEKGTIFFEATPVAHYVVPYYGDNNLYGESYGGEILLKYKPLQQWSLALSYSYLDMHLHKKANSTDTMSESAEGESPTNQLSLFSYLDITPKWQLDVMVYYVDTIPTYGIDSNIMTSVRLGWRPKKDVEITISAHNLFDDKHPEISSRYVSSPTIQIERSIYAKLTLRL